MMNTKLNASKQLIVTNGKPNKLKLFLGQRNNTFIRRKPSTFLVTFKPRTQTTNTKGLTKVLYHNTNPDNHKFLVYAEDVFKGESIFDLERVVTKLRLEQIDEVSEQSQTSVETEDTHKLNSKPVADMNRLTAGCFKLCKNCINKNDSNCRQQADECKLGESIPICDESSAESFENLLFKTTFISDEEENSRRIMNLEEQVEKLHMELKIIRKELAPAEDLFKLNILSERINEISAILEDLKLNCPLLQQASEEIDDIQKTPTPSLRQQSPKVDYLEEYPQKICPSRYTPMWKPSLCYKSPRKYKKNTTPGLSMNQRYNCYKNYPKQEVQVPPRYSRHKPQEFYKRLNVRPPSTSSESTGEGENITKYPYSEQGKYLSTECGFSPKNSTQLEPLAHSTQHHHSLYHYEKPQFKKDYERQCKSFPNTSNPPPNSKAERRYAISLDSSLNQTLIPDTKRPTLSVQTQTEISDIEPLPRLPESYEKQSSTQSYAEQRKSAGEECEFSLTNLSSSDVGTTSNDYTSNDMNPGVYVEIPVITKDLSKALEDIIENIDHKIIALTILLQSNNLYHISVSVIHTGQSLGCIYVTEKVLKRAKRQNLFESFLTFFVLKSNSTPEQRTKVLGHSFELVDTSS